MDLSPLDYMMKQFPEVKERDEMRRIIGRYGITGKAQVSCWKCYSIGKKKYKMLKMLSNAKSMKYSIHYQVISNCFAKQR